MSQLLHFGEIVAMNAYLSPDKVGARDLTRSLTFRGWNDRSCKLANALIGLGLEKGDRIAVLAYNCLEWMEIYAAVAKAGLVVVPINFRLIGSEVRYIVENSEAKAVIVQDDLLDRVETIRAERLIAETAEAFRGAYCTVGDMARRDQDGYYYLADRKSNMIISGGEKIYPSEVEQVLGAHPKVKDLAVIGVAHEK